jgi:peptidoglycan/LPS O-acetylase OafA/YrhL
MILAIVSVLSETAPEKTPGWYRLAIRRPGVYWLLALATYLINCAQPFDTPGTAHFQSAPAALVRSALLLLSGVFLVLPLFPQQARSPFIELATANPVSRYLGRISYGLYLWHFFVMYLYLGSGSVFGGPPVPVQAFLGQNGFWKLCVVTLLGTITVATISYYVVERPIIILVERRVRARMARRASVSPADLASNPVSPAPAGLSTGPVSPAPAGLSTAATSAGEGDYRTRPASPS